MNQRPWRDNDETQNEKICFESEVKMSVKVDGNRIKKKEGISKETGSKDHKCEKRNQNWIKSPWYFRQIQLNIHPFKIYDKRMVQTVRIDL